MGGVSLTFPTGVLMGFGLELGEVLALPPGGAVAREVAVVGGVGVFDVAVGVGSEL